MIKAYTKLERQGLGEYGYGIYINAYIVDENMVVKNGSGTLRRVDGEAGLWASEFVPFDATPQHISKARRRVRERAKYQYLRELYG